MSLPNLLQPTVAHPTYTPPADPTNMNSGAMKGDYERGAYNLYQMLLPMLQGQMAFGAGLQPQKQALMQQLLQSMSPEGMANLTRMFGQQQAGMATDQGQKMAGQLRSQGLSSGAQAGAILGAQNNATKASNQFAYNAQSPAGQMQAGQAALGMINGAQNPDLSAFQGLGSDIYSKPLAVQHGGGLGQILGTVAGSYFGGPAGGALGGALGGGGSSGGSGVGGGIGSIFGSGGYGGNPMAGSGILGSNGNYTMY